MKLKEKRNRSQGTIDQQDKAGNPKPVRKASKGEKKGGGGGRVRLGEGMRGRTGMRRENADTHWPERSVAIESAGRKKGGQVLRKAWNTGWKVKKPKK